MSFERSFPSWQLGLSWLGWLRRPWELVSVDRLCSFDKASWSRIRPFSVTILANFSASEELATLSNLLLGGRGPLGWVSEAAGSSEKAFERQLSRQISHEETLPVAAKDKETGPGQLVPWQALARCFESRWPLNMFEHV